MGKTIRLLALSLAAMLLVFSGASGALATHKAGHQEPPSCDEHPQGGPQNKHCEAPAPEPEPQPSPTTAPPAVTPPVGGQGGPPNVGGGGAGGGGGGGNGGGGGGGNGGGGVAPAPDAVTTDTLPFTGLDVPQAILLFSLLLGLGGISLALGKRRAATIK